MENNHVDISLNSIIVSRQHGEIRLIDNNYFYTDLLSTNGTMINNVLFGKDNPDRRTKCILKDGDVIKIGARAGDGFYLGTIIIIFSTSYINETKWFSQHISGNTAEINIGRDTGRNGDLQIEDNMVSHNHATFFIAKKGWAVIDHHSTNGVYVNNRKISEPIYLKKFDVIRIVNFYFLFLEDKILFQNVSIKNKKDTEDSLSIHIVKRSVWQKFKKLTLLQDINIRLNNGEMVMILGGSGAGKTTFMNAVMGYEKAEGCVFHKGTDIYNNYELMKYEIGYVPQQDLLRGNDTVFDTLSNAAYMKLPKHITQEKRLKRVDEVLEILGLKREHTFLVSKLSGGQRKRLSIAVELIANPSLFFLDEPDSGLDGIIAKSLNNNLRSIADTGKIVMVITHSPDRVAKLYDKVIVLAKSTKDNCGHLAFFGSVQDTLAFFDTNTLEGVVQKINRPDEGGEGKSDYYIDKYAKMLG